MTLEQTTSTVTCPHCKSANPVGAQFCESCGMALPSAVRSTPRVIKNADFATTGVGVQLQTEALRKEAGSASRALLWVAAISTILGGIVIGLLYSQIGRMTTPLLVITIEQSAIAVIFWALYIWSRFQPLPAAIVGLALYVTLVGINVFTVMSQFKSGAPQNATLFNGGFGISIRDIIIIAILFKAIQAGLRYRKLVAGGATPAEVINSAGQ